MLTKLFSDDPECDKLGRQTWVVVAIICTEFLICVKFGWDTITKPLPRYIALWWVAGISVLIVYTVVKFKIFKPTRLPKPEKEQVRLSPIHTNYTNDMSPIPEETLEIVESCDETNTSDNSDLLLKHSNSEQKLLMVNPSTITTAMESSKSNSSNKPKDKNV